MISFLPSGIQRVQHEFDLRLRETYRGGREANQSGPSRSLSISILTANGLQQTVTVRLNAQAGTSQCQSAVVPDAFHQRNQVCCLVYFKRDES